MAFKPSLSGFTTFLDARQCQTAKSTAQSSRALFVRRAGRATAGNLALGITAMPRKPAGAPSLAEALRGDGGDGGGAGPARPGPVRAGRSIRAQQPGQSAGPPPDGVRRRVGADSTLGRAPDEPRALRSQLHTGCHAAEAAAPRGGICAP
jgi:hypothetical protein